MNFEIQLCQAQENQELGKKILQDVGMELQVLAAPRWLWVGWNSLFPHWDLGLGLNQCSQYSMEPLPFPTLLPARMRPWKGGKGIIPSK